MSTYIGIVLGMFGISSKQLILATVMPTDVTSIGEEIYMAGFSRVTCWLRY